MAAWAVTPAAVARRDVSYQRGFPLTADPAGPPVDRGHLIPHLSGGEFGPNIFRQDRALNRGWSDEGKRFRIRWLALLAVAAVEVIDEQGLYFLSHGRACPLAGL